MSKNKFEELDEEIGPAIQKILPGAKVGQIIVVFIDDDDTIAEVKLTREGFVGRFPDEEE